MKAHLPLFASLFFSLAAAVTLAQDVTILTTFPGDTGPGPKDNPDNSGAVGPNHCVDFTDANFVVHDKKTGKVLQKLTQTEFWKAANNTLDLPTLNDPRMLYDPLASRFFAVIANRTNPSFGFLAVSSSDDPTKPWKALQLPMPPADLGFKLGLDKNGLYMCFITMTGDTHTMHSCYAIPMADAIAAEGPSLQHLQKFDNLEIESFPAMDPDPHKPADAPEILLNREFGNTFSKLYMYKITWAGNTASITKAQYIPLSKTYISPNGSSLKNQATQPPPGGKLRADEGRRTTCVYAFGGSIFACNEAKSSIDSRPGIFWCEVRAADGVLLQEGFVDDKNCDYLAPSLAVDANGNVGLGCTRTSETEFPSAYVMMHAAGDPKNSMRPPVLACKGAAIHAAKYPNKFGIAWGNYNATCRDPSDPAILWTSQEYAANPDPGIYSTCWTAFKLK